jgi:peptidyl-prolyl cis-trans isomerase B (cyclophilin B)
MLKRLVAVTATVLSVSVLAACGTETEASPGSGSSASDSTESSESSGEQVECQFTEDGSPAAKEVEIPEATGEEPGEVEATMTTNVGDITATLDGEKAPCTVRSFVSLADQDYFSDTECHRLTTQGIFVLQCGDPTATGTGGPGYTVPDEFDGSETYPAGTLAMANTGQPDSGGSQFFVVYADTQLPPAYTVFGQLDKASIETVSKVAEQGTTTPTGDGPPKQKVQIESVTVG